MNDKFTLEESLGQVVGPVVSFFVLMEDMTTDTGGLSENGVVSLGNLCRALREQLYDDIRDFATVVEHRAGKIHIKNVDSYQKFRFRIKFDAELIRTYGRENGLSVKVDFSKAQKKASSEQPETDTEEA